MLKKYKKALIDPNYIPDPYEVLEEEVMRKLKRILNNKK
jgi:hypothetical protein